MHYELVVIMLRLCEMTEWLVTVIVNSTVNIASCLLGSAQSNMATVKTKLLRSVILLSFYFWTYFDMYYAMLKPVQGAKP